jgi:hypothetical protein
VGSSGAFPKLESYAASFPRTELHLVQLARRIFFIALSLLDLLAGLGVDLAYLIRRPLLPAVASATIFLA